MAFTSASELISRIEAAWPNVAWRGERACPHHCWECDELDQEVRKAPWQEFSPQQVFYLHAGTSLLSDEAFAHFLPAYLRASLIDRETADVAMEFTAWKFLPDNPARPPDRNPDLLNADQREVLFDWLEWFIRGSEGDYDHLLGIVAHDDRHRRVLELMRSKERAKLDFWWQELRRLRETYGSTESVSWRQGS